MNEIWIIVIIFIIIAIILGLALWLFWPQITGASTDTPQISRVGFLQSCGGTVQCQTDLTCQAGICLKNDGQSCSISTDCISNQCVGATVGKLGTCSSGMTGGLNGPSPCEGDLAPNSDGICKGTDGFVGCASQGTDINSNCLSGLCLNNICQPLRTLGQSCQTGQCQSGLTCSLGFCQMTGTETGQNGAFCVPGGTPGCEVPFSCSSDTNTCTSGTESLGGPCNNNDTFCQPGLICLNQICSYSTPPGDCSRSQSCSNGYECINNQCLGQPGSICSAGSDCLSGNCSSNQLSIFKWNDTPTELGWSEPINLPAGVTFSRFLATTLGSTDTFWGLEFSDQPGEGGLYVLSNPSTGTWTRTISGTSQTLSLTGSLTDTILTIATDQTRIYALVRTTDNTTGSQSWSIKQVMLDVSNSASLVDLPNLNPPRTISNSLTNIIDFDINQNRDIVLIGSDGSALVRIYSKTFAATFFTLVTVPSEVENVRLVRFYFLIPTLESFGLMEIDNSINISYLATGQSSTEAERLLFTGSLTGQIYPTGSLTTGYRIVDFSIGPMDSMTISNIWLSTIGISNPATDTSYLQVISGQDFQIPGYVGLNSLLYTTPNATYTQSEGLCVSNSLI